jgi:hypothetical protein
MPATSYFLTILNFKKMKKQNAQAATGLRLLNRNELRMINGGACNPGTYYNKPCTSNLQCGAECSTILYCYCPPGSSSGKCLFK